jgi:hypothetical protein
MIILERLIWIYLRLSSGDGKMRDGDNDNQKQRQHLLYLNQIIARQVMEKSRMVAGIL